MKFCFKYVAIFLLVGAGSLFCQKLENGVEVHITFERPLTSVSGIPIVIDNLAYDVEIRDNDDLGWYRMWSDRVVAADTVRFPYTSDTLNRDFQYQFRARASVINPFQVTIGDSTYLVTGFSEWSTPSKWYEVEEGPLTLIISAPDTTSQPWVE